MRQFSRMTILTWLCGSKMCDLISLKNNLTKELCLLKRLSKAHVQSPTLSYRKSLEIERTYPSNSVEKPHYRKIRTRIRSQQTCNYRKRPSIVSLTQALLWTEVSMVVIQLAVVLTLEMKTLKAIRQLKLVKKSHLHLVHSSMCLQNRMMSRELLLECSKHHGTRPLSK